MAFSSGDMTRRLKIKNPTDERGARGSSPKAETMDGVIWAQIVPKSGEETEAAGRREGITTHEITVYHTDKITYRTVFESFDIPPRRFEIIALNNVEERDRYLLARCRETAA